MEAVEQYIKGMTFKRCVFGGVDEEDVLLHIKKICEIYQQELEQAKVQQTAYKDLEQEVALAHEQCERWREKAQQNHGQDVEHIKREYQQKYQELTAAVDTIQTVKKEAAVKAQVEAAQEAAKLRSEILTKAEQERKVIEDQMNELRQEASMLRQYNMQTRKSLEEQLAVWQKTLDHMVRDLQGLSHQAPTEDERTKKAQ